MTTTAKATDDRPYPISFRPNEEKRIDERLRLVAKEQDRAVNWVVNDVLDKGLPPLPEQDATP